MQERSIGPGVGIAIHADSVTSCLTVCEGVVNQVLVCDFSKKCSEWRWLPKCPLSLNFLKFSVRGLFLDPMLDASV